MTITTELIVSKVMELNPPTRKKLLRELQKKSFFKSSLIEISSENNVTAATMQNFMNGYAGNSQKKLLTYIFDNIHIGFEKILEKYINF
jgi:hypothetical protein